MLRDLWDDVRSMWVDLQPLERIGLAVFLPLYVVAWVLARVFDFDS